MDEAAGVLLFFGVLVGLWVLKVATTPRKKGGGVSFKWEPPVSDFGTKKVRRRSPRWNCSRCPYFALSLPLGGCPLCCSTNFYWD